MRSQRPLIVTSLCLVLVSLHLAEAATPDEPAFCAGAETSNITPPISSVGWVKTQL